jgi:hypothetical protein
MNESTSAEFVPTVSTTINHWRQHDTPQSGRQLFRSD